MCKRIMTLLIISLFLLSGCSSTKLVSSWSKPNFNGPTLKKILVLAVSNNELQRHLYEESFAEKLRTEGVDVIPSYTVINELGSNKEENEKLIKAAVAKTAVDGVLIATLAGIEHDEQYIPASTVTVTGRGGSYGMFGYYGHSHLVIYQLGDTVSSTTVKLRTAVFSAKTEEMLWAGSSKRVNPDSSVEVVDENIDLISAEMKKAGLL